MYQGVVKPDDAYAQSLYAQHLLLTITCRYTVSMVFIRDEGERRTNDLLLMDLTIVHDGSKHLHKWDSTSLVHSFVLTLESN